MASVTSITVARAEQIEDNSVVSGHMAGNDLILVTGGGTAINCGRVIPPASNNWPIGSIFMHTAPDNPNTLLGGGTWARWGRGRVPVSVDEGDPEFATVQKAGGAKTHTLAATEMPAHNHSSTTDWQSSSHTHSGTTDNVNTLHNHGYDGQATRSDQRFDGQNTSYSNHYPVARTSDDGYHTHTFGTGWANQDHYHAMRFSGGVNHGSNGDGATVAHNNLQPYITVYMWQRTG